MSYLAGSAVKILTFFMLMLVKIPSWSTILKPSQGFFEQTHFSGLPIFSIMVIVTSIGAAVIKF